MREVADLLGNTRAVARTSYVDPRIVDLHHGGTLADRGAGFAPPERGSHPAYRHQTTTGGRRADRIWTFV
jgi:DNA topoisomerase IB